MQCPPEHKHFLTTNCYFNHGCRCEECVENVRAVWRERNDARFAGHVEDFRGAFLSGLPLEVAVEDSGLSLRGLVKVLKHREEWELLEWLEGGKQ